MHVFAEELKKGMCLRVGGFPYVVINSERIKYGKGAPFIRVELLDALSDTTRQIQLHPVARLEKIDLVIKRMQYLRSNGECSIFLDVESQEKTAIPNDFLGEDERQLNEGNVRRAIYVNGGLFAVAQQERS